ncbi:MAG: polymer-forming cytoskeletal protein [Myxococcota bacterium]
MTRNDLTGLGEINALLGRGTEYDGKLTFQGRVRIDGNFRGEIFSEGILILGDEADVQANITVGTLIIRGGSVRGDITAHQLIEVHAPGRVIGDVHAPQLFLEKGVIFEGHCVMNTKVHDFSSEGPDLSFSSPGGSPEDRTEQKPTSKDEASLPGCVS